MDFCLLQPRWSRYSINSLSPRKVFVAWIVLSYRSICLAKSRLAYETGMKALLMPKAKVEHNMELALAACSTYQSKSLIPERGLNNSVVPGDGTD